MFEAEVFAQRRNALRQLLNGGVVVLLGNLDSPMNYHDNIYPFIQDTSFRYFFGINQPGWVGVMDLDNGKDYLFVEPPNLHDIVWTGPLASPLEQAGRVGVYHVHDIKGLVSLLQKAAGAKRDIHYLQAYRGDNVLLLEKWLQRSTEDVRASFSVPLTRAIVQLRAIKSTEEIQEMESALSVTAQMHLAAMRYTKPGVYEREVVGRMEGIMREQDLQLAYPVIFSHRGEVLHNHDHSHCMQAGDWIVNDTGCTSAQGYASDITRTLPVSGRFSALQKDLYQIVYDAQKVVLDQLRPGVPFMDMHKLSCQTLVKGMIDMKVFKGDPVEIVESGAYAIVFQCGLGHHIGMDVHDMEGLGEQWVGYGEGYERSALFGMKYLRMAKPMREGYVMTVEPGLYFIPTQFAQWRAENRFGDMIQYHELEKFMGVGGVRIEDDVLITANGMRVLGPHIPRTAVEVEEAMQC